MRLGGVEIPDHPGLAGHSDADALLHAICDALLGAAGLGDIGKLFPPDDPTYSGADSRELTRQVAERVRGAGWGIENVDTTVLAERPRIAPYTDQMIDVISDVLSVDRSQVGVKATTMEGMGFIGREEGIAALAIATIGRA